jgi:hypothetical protein
MGSVFGGSPAAFRERDVLLRCATVVAERSGVADPMGVVRRTIRLDVPRLPDARWLKAGLAEYMGLRGT